jgi:hypothetical protein
VPDSAWLGQETGSRDGRSDELAPWRWVYESSLCSAASVSSRARWPS